MVEQAFKISPNTPLYNIYFASKDEKDKFHKLAREFFAKYGFVEDNKYSGYYFSEDLRMQLSPEDREKYAPQLRKLVDGNEICYFKVNSKMNKAWRQEVVAHINMDKLDGTWFWYFPYIDKGKYSLWHDGKNLYGYLMDEHKDSLALADYMIPIKMSEYYAIKESLEERMLHNES